MRWPGLVRLEVMRWQLRDCICSFRMLRLPQLPGREIHLTAPNCCVRRAVFHLLAIAVR
jgi:hypothetical protein